MTTNEPKWWEGDDGRNRIAALIARLHAEGELAGEDESDTIYNATKIIEKPWNWTAEYFAMMKREAGK